MQRPYCQACGQNLCAINRYRGEKVYYRRRCEACIRREKRIKVATPRWQAAGYKKKLTCDICGFQARYSAQLLVYHVDGNLRHTHTRNLKTVCLNCVITVRQQDLIWKIGDLEPDH